MIETTDRSRHRLELASGASDDAGQTLWTQFYCPGCNAYATFDISGKRIRNARGDREMADHHHPDERTT